MWWYIRVICYFCTAYNVHFFVCIANCSNHHRIISNVYNKYECF